jgi:hypothetical protein
MDSIPSHYPLTLQAVPLRLNTDYPLQSLSKQHVLIHSAQYSNSTVSPTFQFLTLTLESEDTCSLKLISDIVGLSFGNDGEIVLSETQKRSCKYYCRNLFAILFPCSRNSSQFRVD